MSLDELAREATRSLREDVDREIDPSRMLTSVRRTRSRRRLALVVPVAAAVVAVTVALQVPTTDHARGPSHPGPVTPSFVPLPHTNGELIGTGNAALTGPHVPPLADWSSPTFSPDGNELAVLAGGILVTDVRNGDQRRIACDGCTEIAWSPDGGRFAAVSQGRTDIDLVDAESGRATPLGLTGLTSIHSPTWSPTADRLAFAATTTRTKSGVFTVNADGTGSSALLGSPLGTATRVGEPARMARVSWSSTDRLAILTLNPVRGSGGDLEVDVTSINPDGSRRAALGTVGTCACAGWVPNLVWSPDGSSLALYTLGRPHESPSLTGDGSSVHLRFVPGSGPLAWQPR